VNIAELETKTVTELRDIARDLELSGYTTLKKQDLVFRLLQAHTEQQGNIFSAGVLEIVEDGFGFLRQERFLPGNMDVYVSQSQIRRCAQVTWFPARCDRRRITKSTMACCVSKPLME
jgi:transcription termination factor Rho